MIEIYAVKLNENISKKIFNELMTYVSIKKRQRINKFHNFEDAERTLIGDILARYMLCHKMDVKNHELDFNKNEFGKPFVANNKQIHFNISHSRNWVVGCCSNHPIGIDIEYMESIDYNLAEIFFSTDEYKSLTSNDGIIRHNLFYDLWTLKESYIKAVGKGLSIPLNSFTIRFNENEIFPINLDESLTYYFRQYDIDKNYKMAVCATEYKFPTNVNTLGFEMLYKDIKNLYI